MNFSSVVLFVDSHTHVFVALSIKSSQLLPSSPTISIIQTNCVISLMDVDLEHVPSQIGTATIDINNGKILKVSDISFPSK